MSEQNTKPPGSRAAVEAGCCCPEMDNAYGRGYMGMVGIYAQRDDCPLHGARHSEKPICAMRELHARLVNLSEWRKECWRYDDDMGNDRRDFDDEELWIMIEAEARWCADKLQSIMQDIARIT